MEGHHRPRRRYIGFRVVVEGGPPPDRRTMVEALDRACRVEGLPDARRLTVFTGGAGIARCDHLEAEVLRRALGSITEVGGRQARIETLVTSGTIKKVKSHLGLGREA